MKKFILVFVLLNFLVACKSTPPVVEEPQPQTTNETVMVIDTSQESQDIQGLVFPEGVSIRDTERGRVLVVNPSSNYGFASTNMHPNMYAYLGVVLEFMNNNDGVNIVIEGHTSNLGRAYPYNYNLSVQRARNAKAYFVNNGISENRLIESPLGESLPEYPGQSPLRRHEFVIIESEDDLRIYNDFVSRLDIRKETTYVGN